MAKKKRKKLTDRQQAFVNEYLKDPNALRAYRAAGYKAKGHSAESAASQLLSNVEVSAAIAAGQKAIAERALVRVEDVVRGLLAEARRAGEGSSQGARVSAWGLLGKYLGMFAERHELTGKNGGPIRFIVEPA